MNVQHRRLMMRTLVLSVVIALVLPLIPYAWSSLENGAVPNPGTQLWRDVRQRDGAMVGSTQVAGVDTGVLINAYGERWRHYRMNELVPYGAYAMGGVLAFIGLYFLVRRRMRIAGGRSGEKMLRFTLFQRWVHWSAAVLFLLLALTGLVLLYGRFVLIPLLGPQGFGATAEVCKWTHNISGPLFIIAITVMFITYLPGNLPAWRDIKWVLKGGGFFGGHASAGRYNAGEKAWFWSTCLLGLLLGISGVVLLDLITVFGQGREFMEFAHVVHSVIALFLICFSFGHMYLATIGMEGALESMTTGFVDTNWAKAHHDVWYEEEMAETSRKVKSPVSRSGTAQVAEPDVGG